MFCKNCGNQLNDGALFCPKCGQQTGSQTSAAEASAQPVMQTVTQAPVQPAPQSMAQEPVQPVSQPVVQTPVQPAVQPNAYYANQTVNVSGEKNKKKKRKAPIIVIASLLVIIAVAGGLFWFKSQSSEDADDDKEVSASAKRSESDDDASSRKSRSERTDKDSSRASSQASIDELLGYIDQADSILSDAVIATEELSEEEFSGELLTQGVSVLEKSLSDFSDIRTQAYAVSGIDANLEYARNEYFSMAYDSLYAYYEVWDFLNDFMDLVYVMVDRPNEDNYSSINDYYNDLYTWYNSVKEGYASIDSCPSCLESEWKQLDAILDLNESIVQKMYMAEQYVDFLRFYSAKNMSNRYDTVTMLQIEEFMDVMMDEVEFFGEQMDLAVSLAEEIRTYAGLGEEQSAYEFKNIHNGELTLSYDVIDTIYPSLYRTYDAFVIVKAGCLSGSKNILVEAEIPGLTQKYKESFTVDTAYRTIYIKPPALTGDLDLSSAKDAQISVTVSEQDGTLIEAKTFPVTIQSKYDVRWYSDEYGVATRDNILCFLTPESSAISQLKRQAIDEISDMTGGSIESFVGYQEVFSNHYVNTYIQVAGIMRAMYETGVRYNMDTFSLSNGHQHVLFPEDVLKQQSGLCIETSLVVASALQSAGMHAFLVFPPGHAQVAVEIWKGNGEGAGEYFLIETTALEQGSNNRSIFVENANALFDYENLGTSPITYKSQEEWLSYIAPDDTYIIDCDDSNVLGLTQFAN